MARVSKQYINDMNLRVRSAETRVAELLDAIRTTMKEDGTTEEIRSRLESEKRPALEKEAERRVVEAITAELDARTDSEVEAMVAELREHPTRAIARHRNSEADRCSALWREASLEEVLKQVTDEEDRRALQQRIDQIKQEADEADREAESQRIKDSFEGTGIDLNSIEGGTKVELTLGKYHSSETYTEIGTDDWGNRGRMITKEGPTIRPYRVINAIAIGEGRFRIINDSLSTVTISDSDYVQSMVRGGALSGDLVVTFGNSTRENGQGQYSHKVTADTILWYDDNTTDDSVISTRAPLANIKIGDIEAREAKIINQ